MDKQYWRFIVFIVEVLAVFLTLGGSTAWLLAQAGSDYGLLAYLAAMGASVALAGMYTTGVENKEALAKLEARLAKLEQRLGDTDTSAAQEPDKAT